MAAAGYCHELAIMPSVTESHTCVTESHVCVNKSHACVTESHVSVTEPHMSVTEPHAQHATFNNGIAGGAKVVPFDTNTYSSADQLHL